MERYDSDRLHGSALHLDGGVSPSTPDIFNAPVADDSAEGKQLDPVSSDRQVETPPETLLPTVLEPEVFTKVRTVFDQHLHRLEHLKAGLRTSPDEPDALEMETNELPRWTPQRRPRQAPPSYLLPETLFYLHGIEYPPLLPAPKITTFEEAFRRHEPMFHTVFYRKYPPHILDDAKQEGLLALFRKWLKDKRILDQASAYVTTAAIYGVSNWRQKGMQVRGKEGALLVDAHGKVMGEPHVHSQERWTDRIDLKLDVAQAVEVVLYQYKEQPECRDIYRIVEHLRGEILFTEAQRTSGLSLRTFKREHEQVKAGLREQLADYTTV